MSEPQILEVRVSRLCTTVLGGVGLLFIVAGLDIGYFKTVLDFTIGPEKKWILYAFIFFANVIGGVIFVQMVWYFFHPPLMMRVDEKGITFATRMRYVPFFIEGKYVKSVGRGITVDLTSQISFLDVVIVKFEESPDIPSWNATPPGMQYFQYELALSWFYRDTSSFKIIDAINAFLATDKWSSNRRYFQAVSNTPVKNKVSLP